MPKNVISCMDIVEGCRGQGRGRVRASAVRCRLSVVGCRSCPCPSGGARRVVALPGIGTGTGPR